MNVHMSEYGSQFAELFIAKEDGRSTVRLFTARPTPLEEKNLGRLFGVLEIDSQDSINEEILHVIEDVIVSEYYRAEATEVETAFEVALQQVNKKVHELVADIGDEWLNSVNMLLGVQKGHSVIFANIGHVIAMLIQKDQIIDILDTTKAKAQDINPMKVFTNIVTGEAPKDSAVLFATETMLDYLSKEKIRRIVFGNAPEVAVQEFRTLLEEDTTNSNFASVIFEYRDVVAVGSEKTIPVINRPSNAAPSVNDNDSMEELLGKQTSTDELLSTSLWPSIKKSMRNYVDSKRPDGEIKTGRTQPEEDDLVSHPSTNTISLKSSERNGEDGLGPIAAKEKDAPWKIIAKKIGSALLKGTVALLVLIKNLILKATKAIIGLVKGSRGTSSGRDMVAGRRQTKNRGGSVGDRTASTVGGIVKWFTGLTLLQRIFLVVAVVVLLLFAQSVINRGEQNISKEQEQTFSQTITDIDLKINEGKAAALFDKEKARTLFIDARDLLGSVPEDSDAFKTRGEELTSIISAELEQVNNITRIENPTVAIDYRSINPDIQVSDIILLGASMYGFDASNQSVYRGNLETQEATVTISDSSSDVRFAAVSKASPGTGLVGLTDDSFATFSPISESLTPIDLSIENTDRSVVDVVLFGIRLYTLDTLNNKIFRHRASGEIFEAGESWLTGAEDISNGVSMAIDGSIYVLLNNGELRRYSNGDRDDFNLAPLDPALDSADVVYTDENTESIYILDSANKRILVFSKEGSLEAQYTSDTFNDPQDMVVDEAAGKVYILDNGRVYEINLDDQQANAGTAKTKTASA